jgi:hypothetical protein
MKIRRPGRPPLPNERRQRNRVQVALNDEELKRLCAAAGDEPLGSYIRRVLLRHLGRSVLRRKR